MHETRVSVWVTQVSLKLSPVVRVPGITGGQKAKDFPFCRPLHTTVDVKLLHVLSAPLPLCPRAFIDLRYPEAVCRHFYVGCRFA